MKESEFWACVTDGTPPNRGHPPQDAESLPADLVHLLINRVGLGEEHVARMSKVGAVERLNRYWATGI
ncbi:MAG: hypothetical protein ACLPTB_16005 [Acidimicrobiales bacterium]